MVSKVLRGEGWEVGGDQGRDRMGVNVKYAHAEGPRARESLV